MVSTKSSIFTENKTCLEITQLMTLINSMVELPEEF